MPDPFDDLLADILADQADTEPKAHASNWSYRLQGDRAHARRPARRTTLDLRKQKAALAHLQRLPDEGETIHLVTAGEYALWNYAPAILDLAAPRRIAYLGVATLGFSRRNIEDLIALLDAGQIQRVDFLFSAYFQGTDGQPCAHLTRQLIDRGHRAACIRTHAKMLLIELDDGAGLVVESSANLRSCGNIEQSTYTRDRALFDFHAQWFREVMAANPAKIKPAPRSSSPPSS